MRDSKLNNPIIVLVILFSTLVSYPLFGSQKDLIKVTDKNEQVIYEGSTEDFPLELLQDGITIEASGKYSWVDWKDLTIENLEIKNLTTYQIYFKNLSLFNFICIECDIDSIFEKSSISSSSLIDSDFLGSLEETTVKDISFISTNIAGINYCHDSVIEDSLFEKTVFKNSLNITNSKIINNTISDSSFQYIQLEDSTVSENQWNRNRFTSILSSNSEMQEPIQSISQSSKKSGILHVIANSIGRVIFSIIIFGFPFFIYFFGTPKYQHELIPFFLATGVLLVQVLIYSVCMTAENPWVYEFAWVDFIMPNTIIYLILFVIGTICILADNPKPSKLVFMTCHLIVHVLALGLIWFASSMIT